MKKSNPLKISARNNKNVSRLESSKKPNRTQHKKHQDNQPKIKAVLGLGNPLDEYKNTYHNIGLMMLEKLAGADFDNISNKEFLTKKVNGVIFGKTKTFMNESGRAVKQFIDYFKIKPEELAVIHDDSDMTVGNFKISFNQNSGGHKGIDSVIQQIKTKEFWRIKIGIRPEEEIKRKKAEEFVLKNISKKDGVIIKNVFEKVSNELSRLIK